MNANRDLRGFRQVLNGARTIGITILFTRVSLYDARPPNLLNLLNPLNP